MRRILTMTAEAEAEATSSKNITVRIEQQQHRVAGIEVPIVGVVSKRNASGAPVLPKRHRRYQAQHKFNEPI